MACSTQLTLDDGEVIALKIALERSLATYSHMVGSAVEGSCIADQVAILHMLTQARLGNHHPRYEFKHSIEPLSPMPQPSGERREFLLPIECGGRAYVCLNIPPPAVEEVSDGELAERDDFDALQDYVG